MANIIKFSELNKSERALMQELYIRIKSNYKCSKYIFRGTFEDLYEDLIHNLYTLTLKLIKENNNSKEDIYKKIDEMISVGKKYLNGEKYDFKTEKKYHIDLLDSISNRILEIEERDINSKHFFHNGKMIKNQFPTDNIRILEHRIFRDKYFSKTSNEKLLEEIDFCFKNIDEYTSYIENYNQEQQAIKSNEMLRDTINDINSILEERALVLNKKCTLIKDSNSYNALVIPKLNSSDKVLFLLEKSLYCSNGNIPDWRKIYTIDELQSNEYITKRDSDGNIIWL